MDTTLEGEILHSTDCFQPLAPRSVEHADPYAAAPSLVAVMAITVSLGMEAGEAVATNRVDGEVMGHGGALVTAHGRAVD